MAALMLPGLLARLAPAFLYYPERLPLELSAPRAWGLTGAQELRIPAEDGVRLHAWLADARGPGPARGAAIFFHGNAGHLAHRAPIVADLAELGLDVLLFDYRGYGLSEGRPSEAGLLADARAVYRYVYEGRGTEASRILLVGNSLGGAVAALLAAEVPVAGLVSTGSFRSVPHVAARIYPWLPRRAFAWKRNRFDAAGALAGARLPVLVAWGTEDEVIPAAETRALFEAIPEPKRAVEVAGVGHADLWGDPGLWREVARFVDEVVGPSPDAPRN